MGCGRNDNINFYKFIYIMGKEEIRELILEWVEFTSENKSQLKTQINEFIKTKYTEEDHCHYSGLPSPSSYDKEQIHKKEKYRKSSVDKDDGYDNAGVEDYC